MEARDLCVDLESAGCERKEADVRWVMCGDVMFCDALCAKDMCYSYCRGMLGQYMQPIELLHEII